MTQEYNIPEGYEARIEGNKVIIAQKESEDERIRNLIRRIVISTNDGDLQCLGDDDTKKCLAWLEKQKEQKPEEKYAIPEIKVSEDVSVTSRMKYIPEQLKPIADFILDYASWNLHKDEWNHPVAEVPLFRVLDALVQGGKPYCESGCVKQKPAEWSEKDESISNDILDLLEGRTIASTKRHYAKCSDWLKSLKDRIKGTTILKVPTSKPRTENEIIDLMEHE